MHPNLKLKPRWPSTLADSSRGSGDLPKCCCLSDNQQREKESPIKLVCFNRQGEDDERMLLFSVQLCLDHVTFHTQWLLPCYGPRWEPGEVFLDVCQQAWSTHFKSVFQQLLGATEDRNFKIHSPKMTLTWKRLKCWTTSSLFKVKPHIFGCGDQKKQQLL